MIGVNVTQMKFDESGVFQFSVRSVTQASLDMSYDFNDNTYRDELGNPVSLLANLNRLSSLFYGGQWQPVVMQDILTNTHDSEQSEAIASIAIYKADFTQLGNRPTLIEFYGGFGLNFLHTYYLDPTYSRFIDDGGMVVLAGIRGGYEKGNMWHRDGAQDKKINAAKDVISVANGLVQGGYTQSQRIAITGTSNGGMITGTALALSPDSFGLAIPVNGVMDPIASAEKLNTQYEGWSYEYGSINQAASRQSIEAHSPYALITERSYPTVLAIVGLADDRVHPANSFKFIAKLQKNQTGDAPILMSTIKNAGHHPVSSHREEVRNAYNTRFWTAIYSTIFNH